MIIAKAPMRISLFGGGTDLPFYLEGGGTGLILSMAIDKYVYCSIHKRYDDEIWLNYSKKEKVSELDEIENEYIKSCLMCSNWDKLGIEVSYVSDIPGKGSGLGSSSAFTLSTLIALNEMARTRRAAYVILRDATHVEQECLNKPIGGQDQAASFYGGILNLGFWRGPKEAPSVIRIEDQGLLDYLLLFELPARSSESRGDEILQAAADDDNGSRQILDGIHNIAKEVIEELLPKKDWRAMGKALHDSWKLKRSLPGGVSTPEIDAIYDKAMHSGAWGGKVCGAGGGGFLVLMASPSTHNDIRKELGLRHVPFGIDRLGARVVFNDE